MVREPRVPDCVDAVVEPVQPTKRNGSLYGVL
jgi:hypothetical protein